MDFGIKYLVLLVLIVFIVSMLINNSARTTQMSPIDPVRNIRPNSEVICLFFRLGFDDNETPIYLSGPSPSRLLVLKLT